MQFHIITIFPEIFTNYFNTSIIGRAQKKKQIRLKIHDLRHFTTDRHKTVDDKPYGGGAGMVLMGQPIIKAVDKVKKSRNQKIKKSKIVLFSAKGKQFTQKMAQNYAKNYNQIIMITGRYEGIDERVKIITRAEEISIGPYVLTDGDLPAMVLVSAIARLLPGVIANESLAEESFGNWKLEIENSAQQEYPHYTRPEVIKYKNKNYKVPQVLLSGNHQAIKDWRNKHRANLK